MDSILQFLRTSSAKKVPSLFTALYSLWGPHTFHGGQAHFTWPSSSGRETDSPKEAVNTETSLLREGSLLVDLAMGGFFLHMNLVTSDQLSSTYARAMAKTDGCWWTTECKQGRTEQQQIGTSCVACSESILLVALLSFSLQWQTFVMQSTYL